jgi:ubiquinone/menaquinone biosynthesis C-methylase UbiE
MRSISSGINEQFAADAFSRQSEMFDKLYAANTIIQYKRQRVRNLVLKYLPEGSSILELNSGTGEDAVFFAQQGSYHVHATDISVGMQDVLKQKIINYGLQKNISTELCSFTQLHLLKNKGPYDLIFSNFGGLNCTNELEKVLNSFENLLNPNGIIILVIISKFCLWESLLLFKGKFKTATRRWFSSNGTKAHIIGQYFRCWYYTPFYITRQLKKTFSVLSVEGLCSLVPPSYIENFAQEYPVSFRILKEWENRLKGKWPWKYIGDYFIISIKRKPVRDL